jgi:hypothetical protein
MSKRQKADKSRLGDELNEINEKAAAVTGADKGKGKGKIKTFSSDDIEPPAKKQEPDRTIKGRKKFTTMLHPDLKTKLGNVAKNNQMSIADVLEIIVKEYFDLK